MSHRRGQFPALLLALLIAGTASATTVYRTVDRHGAVSFSDTPPEHAVIPALQLHIETASSTDEEAAARLAAMRETTERMIASRMARERHRAELRKLDAETDLSRAAVDAPYPEQDYTVYREPLYLAPYRRQHSGQRPQPPLRATPPPRRTSYPSSLIRRHYNPQVRQVFE
ncbi:MAG: DUF4124 domain-containing protein [Halioglobus sp.]|nr:DUF4124 domain-containing protein [Halioglobus sp.]